MVIDWKVLYHFATVFQSRLSSHETRKIIPFNLHNSNAFTRTRAHPLRPSPSPIHNQNMHTRSSTFFRKESPQMSRANDFDENFGTIDLPFLNNELENIRLFMSRRICLFPFYTEIFLTIYMIQRWSDELFNHSIYELKKCLTRIYWEDTLYLWNIEFIMEYLYFCISLNLFTIFWSL